MAVIRTDYESNSRKDFLQDCFVGDSLVAVTPRTDSVTIIRPYPQLTPEGTALPMVLGQTNEGLYDFSGIAIEPVVTMTGDANKFTGVVRPRITEPGQRFDSAFDRPFEALYIKLKSSFDKNRLTAEQRALVAPLLEKVKRGNSPVASSLMAQPRDTLFMQCAVLQYRGENLGDKYIPNGVLCASGSVLTALNDVMTSAAQQGIDIFDPENGHTIIFSGLPADKKQGRQTAISTAELGEQMPITMELVQQHSCAWDSAINYLTYDELVHKAIACFGEDVVRIVLASSVDRLVGARSAPTTPRSFSTAAPTAPAAPAVGPPPAARGAVMRPALGAKAAAAPAAAPAATPGALGVRPALGAKPAVAAAQTPAPTAPDAGSLEEEYNKLVGDGSPGAGK